MDVASVESTGRNHVSSTRGWELAAELRAAVLQGDDARIKELLSELLRARGLTKGQRIRLQLRALSNLVHCLRSLALNDEVTGLYNRRGFVQSATRLLDLSMRDGQRLYLVYLCLGELDDIRDAVGQSAADVLARQMGNFMRDLYPSYGVYEVLGRLSRTEFAALTPDVEHASPEAVVRRAAVPRGSFDVPPLPLSVGVALWNPARGQDGVSIDQLLQSAAQAVRASVSASEGVTRIASAGQAPHPGLTLC
jgi:GGDEF domain-containing protein